MSGERPKLNLKPRNEAEAAKNDEARLKSAKSNPFGAAKPREAVLATRSGQREDEILKAESQKEPLKLRLTGEQEEQRSTLQDEIKTLEASLQAEQDPFKTEDLQREVGQKKDELSSLLASFEKLAFDRAKRGEILRPSERMKLAEERGLAQGAQNSPLAHNNSGPYGSQSQYGNQGSFGHPAPFANSGSFGHSPQRANAGGLANSGFQGSTNLSSRSSNGSGSLNRSYEERPRQRTGYDATPSSGARYQSSSNSQNEALPQGPDRFSRDTKAPMGSFDIFASNLSYPNIAPGNYTGGQDRF